MSCETLLHNNNFLALMGAGGSVTRHPDGLFYSMKCRKCKSDNVINEYREDKLQWLTRCQDCSAATWQPKEDNDKYKRDSKHLYLVKKKGLDYCEWCLRSREIIPAPGTLEGHHIIEYKDGGSDDISNILVLCTSCHKLCHHSRTYFGHYKNKA